MPKYYIYDKYSANSDFLMHEGVLKQQWGIRNALWYSIKNFWNSMANLAKTKPSKFEAALKKMDRENVSNGKLASVREAYAGNSKIISEAKKKMANIDPSDKEAREAVANDLREAYEKKYMTNPTPRFMDRSLTKNEKRFFKDGRELGKLTSSEKAIMDNAVRYLSDKELRNTIDRINLEKQYLSAVSSMTVPEQKGLLSQLKDSMGKKLEANTVALGGKVIDSLFSSGIRTATDSLSKAAKNSGNDVLSSFITNFGNDLASKYGANSGKNNTSNNPNNSNNNPNNNSGNSKGVSFKGDSYTSLEQFNKAVESGKYANIPQDTIKSMRGQIAAYEKKNSGKVSDASQQSNQASTNNSSEHSNNQPNKKNNTSEQQNTQQNNQPNNKKGTSEQPNNQNTKKNGNVQTSQQGSNTEELQYKNFSDFSKAMADSSVTFYLGPQDREELMSVVENAWNKKVH